MTYSVRTDISITTAAVVQPQTKIYIRDVLTDKIAHDEQVRVHRGY